MTRILALIWPTLRNAQALNAGHAARAPVDPPAEAESSVDVPAMLDRLDDLSPRVEAVDRGVALVDVTGLGPSLGDERRIAARAVALVREVATLPVRAGVGENRWLAVLAARLALTARPDPAVPVAFHAFPAGLEATRAVLASLPLALLPADPDTRQRFALFGLTFVIDLVDTLLKGLTYFLSFGPLYYGSMLMHIALCAIACSPWPVARIRGRSPPGGARNG